MRMVKLLKRATRNCADYTVIASEAKQSMAQQAEEWIASLSLSSGTHSRDLVARNDDKKKAGIAPGPGFLRLSCPAKAGHPAITAVRDRIDKPRRTGSSGQAGR
jgi:hypothetical protein